MLEILEKGFTFAVHLAIASVSVFFLLQSDEGVLLLIVLMAALLLYGVGFLIKQSSELVIRIGQNVWQCVMKLNMTTIRPPTKDEVGAWIKSDYRENQTLIDQMPLSDRNSAHERNQEMLEHRNDRNMGM
jgi:hypothetical protein